MFAHLHCLSMYSLANLCGEERTCFTLTLLLYAFDDIQTTLQVAYLASGLFLDYRSDLIILVVNTLTQDLKSDNYLVGEGLQRHGTLLLLTSSKERNSSHFNHCLVEELCAAGW